MLVANQDPGIQSFTEVKVTLTLMEVILCHDNYYLIITSRSDFVFNLSIHISTTGSLTKLFINILIKSVKLDFRNCTFPVKVILTFRNDCSPGPWFGQVKPIVIYSRVYVY